jgi:hypothetical protein
MNVAIVIWDQTKDIFTKSYDVTGKFTNIKLNGRKPSKIIISGEMSHDKLLVTKVKKVLAYGGLLITTTGVRL